MPTRILIADDNPFFLKALRQLLERVDHWEIVEAHDGQEAISESLATRPDIVVLDLAMPVKDGLMSAREISKALPQTPILMCTMHASSQVEVEAQKAGVRKMFSKAESHAIVPAIQELLAAKPPAAEAISQLPAVLSMSEATTIPAAPPAQPSDIAIAAEAVTPAPPDGGPEKAS